MAVVLVTGASSGFGEAISLGFLDAGHRVVASMRNPAAAPSALTDRLGPALRIIPLDVTSEPSRREAIEDVLAHEASLDVLVNNAGISLFASLEDTSSEAMRRVFETNYFGPCELMRAVLPIMRRQGRGRIVNISAIGAVLTTPLLNAYCASKHALDASSAAADIEVRPFGVRVLSVLPGQFKTEIGAKSPPPVIGAAYQGMAAHMAKGRAARAADVLTDLSPVVEQVLAAATDAEPRPRYLAGVGIALELKPALAELERLHAFESHRAGVADGGVA
jgi:NAD(P)-dependent dehydrogenase (short-subunit alcohol dehydrogenase family)